MRKFLSVRFTHKIRGETDCELIRYLNALIREADSCSRIVNVMYNFCYSIFPVRNLNFFKNRQHELEKILFKNKNRSEHEASDRFKHILSCAISWSPDNFTWENRMDYLKENDIVLGNELLDVYRRLVEIDEDNWWHDSFRTKLQSLSVEDIFRRIIKYSKTKYIHLEDTIKQYCSEMEMPQIPAVKLRHLIIPNQADVNCNANSGDESIQKDSYSDSRDVNELNSAEAEEYYRLNDISVTEVAENIYQLNREPAETFHHPENIYLFDQAQLKLHEEHDQLLDSLKREMDPSNLCWDNYNEPDYDDFSAGDYSNSYSKAVSVSKNCSKRLKIPVLGKSEMNEDFFKLIKNTKSKFDKRLVIRDNSHSDMIYDLFVTVLRLNSYLISRITEVFGIQNKFYEPEINAVFEPQFFDYDCDNDFDMPVQIIEDSPVYVPNIIPENSPVCEINEKLKVNSNSLMFKNFDSFKEKLFKKYRYRSFTKSKTLNTMFTNKYRPSVSDWQMFFEFLIDSKFISQDVKLRKKSKILKYRFNLKLMDSGKYVSSSYIYERIITSIDRSGKTDISASNVFINLSSTSKISKSRLSEYLNDLAEDGILVKTRIFRNYQFYKSSIN